MEAYVMRRYLYSIILFANSNEFFWGHELKSYVILITGLKSRAVDYHITRLLRLGLIATSERRGSYKQYYLTGRALEMGDFYIGKREA